MINEQDHEVIQFIYLVIFQYEWWLLHYIHSLGENDQFSQVQNGQYYGNKHKSY